MKAVGGAVLVAGLALACAVGAPAALGGDTEQPLYSVTFPDDWTVEDLGASGEPLGPADGRAEGGVRVLIRAYPVDRSEECMVVDLSGAAETLSALGVSDQLTNDRVAVDILGHGGHGTTSSGLGYREPWSSSFEGTTQDGASYALYSYLGVDARPDLEGTWFALDCRADGAFHQDWQQIAKTFEFRPPRGILAGSGPIVIGGRIESPTGGYAVSLPDEWVAVDLTHPDARSMLGSVNAATRWFAEALDGPFGESLDERAAAGQEVRLWAWLPEEGPFWLESCEVTVRAAGVDSITELVEIGAAYVASEPDLQPYHSWSKVDLPMGEAARHDFGWSPTAAGTEYFFLDAGRLVTLSCQDTALEADDVEASRAIWLSIVETFEFLPTEE